MPPELNEESTDTEVSLRDDLEKAFAAAEAPPSGQESTAPAAAPAVSVVAKPVTTSAPAPDTAAPPAGQKPGEDQTQDAKDLAALQAAADSSRPIPERLKAKWGDKWATLDPTVRGQFHEYETDIGRLSSKYGKDAKAWGETLRIVAPYEEMIRSEGGTFHGAISNLLETARILRQGSPEQKVALVQQMIQAYGINYNPAVASAGGEQPGGQQTPVISPELINRINTIERTVLTRDAAEQHNLRQRVNSELEAFLGDQSNVYLQEPGYLDTMQALIASGKADGLKSAYEQAAWLHERPRQLEIAKMNQQRVAQHQQQVVKAKSAAVSVNGTSPGAVKRDMSKATLRETLEAAFDGDLTP